MPLHIRQPDVATVCADTVATNLFTCERTCALAQAAFGYLRVDDAHGHTSCMVSEILSPSRLDSGEYFDARFDLQKAAISAYRMC